MKQDEFFEYIETPEFKAHLKKFEDALSSGEMVYLEAEEMLDIAEYFHSRNDWEMAEKAMKYSLLLHENDPQALLFLTRIAIIYYNNATLAREYYNKVSLPDNNLEKVFVHAELLMSEGRTEAADEYLCKMYEKVQANESKEDEEENGYADINFPVEAAMIFTDHGIYDLAKQWLDKAAEPEDDYNRVCYWDTKSVIYINLNRFDGAKKALNKLLDIDSYNIKAWLMLASAHMNMYEYEDALKCTEFILAIDPNSKEGVLVKAMALFLLGRYRECAGIFEELKNSNADLSNVELTLPGGYSKLDDIITKLGNLGQ